MSGGDQEATGTPQSTGAGTDPALDVPATASVVPPTIAPAAPSTRPDARFAHASEAEMARILDFYEVRWDYEPTTFPILWNTDGDVVESFAPDFYLPDLELFLEMTTLKQRLVRKKNRKLRRLRELYPDIRIKLFYARDFRAMLLKYGRLALVESLSGTIGQVVPERPTAPAVPVDLPIAGIDIVPGLEPGLEPVATTSETPLAGDAALRRGARRRRRTRHTAETGVAREAGA